MVVVVVLPGLRELEKLVAQVLQQQILRVVAVVVLTADQAQQVR